MKSASNAGKDHKAPTGGYALPGDDDEDDEGVDLQDEEDEG